MYVLALNMHGFRCRQDVKPPLKLKLEEGDLSEQGTAIADSKRGGSWGLDPPPLRPRCRLLTMGPKLYPLDLPPLREDLIICPSPLQKSCIRRWEGDYNDLRTDTYYNTRPTWFLYNEATVFAVTAKPCIAFHRKW